MVNGIGISATIASVLLSVSPIQDVRDIHRTRWVAERSILPYCMMMLDGASWVVLSVLVGDAPVGMTNAFGFLAGCVYSLVYLRNSSHDTDAGVQLAAWSIFLGTLVIIALLTTAGIVLGSMWSNQSAVNHIVFVVYFFDVMLYASPLALVWKVFRTGSTSGMYLPLSLAITSTAILRAAYACQIAFWSFAIPQFMGVLAGIAQLSLFLRFRVVSSDKENEADSLMTSPALWWAK